MTFERLLNKKVRIERKINSETYFYHGVLKEVTKEGVWLEDRYTGLIYFANRDIVSLGEWKEEKVKK